MHRHWRRRAVIGVLILAPGSLAQDGPGAPALQGIVRGPDGTALVGASVVAFPIGLDVVGLEGFGPQPAQTATTDGSGAFRVAPGMTSCVLIRHPSGLGALVGRLHPNAPERVMTAPMAEITLPPGTSEAWVRADVSVHAQARLGRFAGPRVLLPPGTYQLLAGVGALASEHRFTVRSGERVQLTRRTDASPPLRVTAARVVVDGWHEAPMAVATNGEFTPWPSSRGISGRDLLLVTDGPSQALAYARWSAAAPHEPGARPSSSWRLVQVRPQAGATAVATLARQADSWRCVAWSPIAPDGTAHVLRGDDHLCVVLGRSIAAFDGTAEELALPPGRDLEVRVVDARGPVADAAVELSGALPQVHRRAFTDARGIATFARVAQSECVVELHARDHWAPPLALDQTQLSAGAVTLATEPGVELAGRVTLAGRALDRVVVDVSLRDTSGALRLRPRHCAPTATGEFVFQGLQHDGRYTLFATAQVKGITFSAKVHGVLPGTEVVLDLRTEDVPPPGR